MFHFGEQERRKKERIEKREEREKGREMLRECFALYMQGSYTLGN